MSKKRVYILAAISISVLLVITLGLFLMNKNQTNKTVAPFSVDYNNPDYELSESDQLTVLSRLSYFLKKSDINTVDLVGLARKDSYTYIESDDGSRFQVDFLVDIPKAKRTYKISIRHNQGFVNIYVLCPSADELIYGTFKCEDDSQEEGE